jgi:hypothetical protein
VFECYPQKLNSDHVLIISVLGMLLCEADMICVFGNLIVSRELEFGRAFREAIGRKIWTFIVGVVVNKIIYFI